MLRGSPIWTNTSQAWQVGDLSVADEVVPGTTEQVSTLDVLKISYVLVMTHTICRPA